MFKIFIADISRSGLKYGVAIVAMLLPAYFFSGDLLTSDQKKGLAAEKAISVSVKSMTASKLVEEVGSVYAYANLCEFDEDAKNVSKALAEKNLTFQDFKEGGAFRASYLRGAERVASLILPDTEKKYKDISCGLGYAAYGPQGAVIPKLLKD